MSSNSVEREPCVYNNDCQLLCVIVYGSVFIFHTGVNRNDTKAIIYGLMNVE